MHSTHFYYFVPSGHNLHGSILHLWIFTRQGFERSFICSFQQQGWEQQVSSDIVVFSKTVSARKLIPRAPSFSRACKRFLHCKALPLFSPMLAFAWLLKLPCILEWRGLLPTMWPVSRDPLVLQHVDVGDGLQHNICVSLRRNWSPSLSIDSINHKVVLPA